MRIQKYLSEKDILSRRKAEDYMRAGKVSVNGEIVKDLGRQIDPAKDRVEVIGGEEKLRDKSTSVIIYKPRGIVSSRIKSEGKTIYEMFPQYEKLHITGRLDKESEGLLLLTDDGVLAKKITGDKHEVEKEYRVFVRENIRPMHMEAMSRGMKLSDGMTLPAKAKRINTHEFNLVLKEGRNHQIRRMADKLKLTVTRLIRVRIGNIKLGGLKEGNYRTLKKEEIADLKK